MGHDAGGHDRLVHRIAIVAEVKGDRSNPHGRSDSRGLLAAPAGRDATFEVAEHLTETATYPPVGASKRALGCGHRQIDLGQSLLLDPARLKEYITKCQSLLCVVRIKASKPPPVRLPLPGLNAVD